MTRSLETMHREICARWKPGGDRIRTTTITDSKHRTWQVGDTTGLDSFGRMQSLGDSAAACRIFWRDDHARAFYLRDARDRQHDAKTLMQQLRVSHRIDKPEDDQRSTSEKLQDLYDGRRGMGRR